MAGDKIIPKIIVTNKINKKVFNKIFANFHASSLPFVVRYSVKTGTTAAPKDPSPKSLRRRLGILKATKKASAAIFVPKRLAMIISRTNPRIRLIKVAPPTAPVARATCSLSFINYRIGRPIF